MRRKTILFCLILGFILSMAIIFAIKVYTEYRIGFKEVYIAQRSLNQRSIIKEEDLQKIALPKDFIRDDVYILKEDLIGKVVKMNHAICKGSLFYKEALEDLDGNKDLIHLFLKEDEVTYDVSVYEVKVNPLYLEVGMYIDLYLTIQDDEVLSDLLFSDVRIVGLYRNNNQDVETISFAILNKDVNILNKAITLGTLSIVVGQDSFGQKGSALLHEETSIFAYLENQGEK